MIIKSSLQIREFYNLFLEIVHIYLIVYVHIYLNVYKDQKDAGEKRTSVYLL